MIIMTSSFSKRSVFRLHENEKPAISISSGLKSVFEKFLSSRTNVDGRPNRRSKAVSSNVSGVFWTGP